MAAAICLTLGAVHLMIWLWQRTAWANLLFAISAFAVAAVAAFELATMRAETPAQYTQLVRWFHVPLWVLPISLVWFMRAYLAAGRLWLAWLITALRSIIIVINFMVPSNFNYRTISNLQIVHWPMGENIAVPVGSPYAWTLLGQFSLVMMIVYFTDIAFAVWRRGDKDRALIAASAGLFITCGLAQSVLIVWGFVAMPFLFSFPFLGIILPMAYRLSLDVHTAATLSKALHESERRVHFTAKAAELGLWSWNVQNDAVWLTKEARTQFGVGQSDAITLQELITVIHPDDRSAVREACDRTVESGTPLRVEYRVILPSGDTRWISVRGDRECDEHGRPVVLRGITVDVSDRKRGELESARQREELTRLSRAATLGELSGSLAHELNQPLTAILSNAQAAQRFLSHDNADILEVREILADIVEDDRRAGKVISNVRMLLKNGEVSRETFDVNELVRDTLCLVQSDLMNSSAKVRTELSDDPTRIYGDRVQIQQVLLNLIINACHALADAADTRREITIGTAESTGSEVHITVSDDGCGIPAHLLERIFEPLFTTRPEGMGLGLAVCRTIVSAHEGRLWAAHNNGGGATFHLILPNDHGVRT